jgi:predicted aminopeptidase
MAIASAAAACLLAGAPTSSLLAGDRRQTDLLARAKPITDVIATTPDPALRRRLVRAQEIRAFASRELGLPDNRSYTSYADLERPYAVWNVFATPELSLTPRQWCFPVAGCVAYRGYFAEADARAEAARLAAAGDDVHLSGIPAYSTLGYFDDPVLSTFVRYREVELARLIFHELAHQVVIQKTMSFNESFAVLWRRRASPAGSRPKAGRAIRRSRRACRDAERGRSCAPPRVDRDDTERLAALYASDASDDEKRARRRPLPRCADYEALKGCRAAALPSSAGSRPARTTPGSRRSACTPIGMPQFAGARRRGTATRRFWQIRRQRWRRCPRTNASPR